MQAWRCNCKKHKLKGIYKRSNSSGAMKEQSFQVGQWTAQKLLTCCIWRWKKKRVQLLEKDWKPRLRGNAVVCFTWLPLLRCWTHAEVIFLHAASVTNSLQIIFVNSSTPWLVLWPPHPLIWTCVYESWHESHAHASQTHTPTLWTTSHIYKHRQIHTGTHLTTTKTVISLRRV